MSGADSVGCCHGSNHSGSSSGATNQEKADFLRALANLIDDNDSDHNHYSGSNSDDCSDSSSSSDSCCHRSDSSADSDRSSEPTINLKDVSLGWHGDPHGHGEGEVNGSNVDFKLVTKGGDGENINWLTADKSDGDESDISIVSRFETLNRKDDNTYATDTTITVGEHEIMVDPGDDSDKTDSVIAVDGETISECDLEDGYYVCENGTKVTKDGNKIIIATEGGDKIVLQDKGKYLDAENIELADGEYDEVGGMLGDGLTTNLKTMKDDEGNVKKSGDEVHVDANDYLAEEKPASGCDCNTQQGAEWAAEAADLLYTLANIVDSSELQALLNAAADMLKSGNIDNKEDVADYLNATAALVGDSDDADLLTETANVLTSGDLGEMEDFVSQLEATG